MIKPGESLRHLVVAAFDSKHHELWRRQIDDTKLVGNKIREEGGERVQASKGGIIATDDRHLVLFSRADGSVIKNADAVLRELEGNIITPTDAVRSYRLPDGKLVWEAPPNWVQALPMTIEWGETVALNEAEVRDFRTGELVATGWTKKSADAFSILLLTDPRKTAYVPVWGTRKAFNGFTVIDWATTTPQFDFKLDENEEFPDFERMDSNTWVFTSKTIDAPNAGFRYELDVKAQVTVSRTPVTFAPKSQ